MLKFACCCVIVLLGKSFALAAENDRESRSGQFGFQNSDNIRYAAPDELDNEDNNYAPPFFGGFNYGNPNSINDFFPEYFRNFEHLLQKTFNSDFGNQQRALDAAQKAFDLTSKRTGFSGYNPSFDFRFPEFPPMPPFQGFRNFGSGMNMGPNSAFAFGAIGPDFKHQMAAINPDNPTMKNVNVFNRIAEMPSQPGFKSVSSFSSSVSKNVNGRPVNERVAETLVNENGKITKYSVHN